MVYDVREHAYHLQYANHLGGCVAGFRTIIDRPSVALRHVGASGATISRGWR
jgi:hypothetical protein